MNRLKNIRIEIVNIGTDEALPPVQDGETYIVLKVANANPDFINMMNRLFASISAALSDDNKISIEEVVGIVLSAFSASPGQVQALTMLVMQARDALSDNRISFFEAISLAMTLMRIVKPGLLDGLM